MGWYFKEIYGKKCNYEFYSWFLIFNKNSPPSIIQNFMTIHCLFIRVIWNLTEWQTCQWLTLWCIKRISSQLVFLNAKRVGSWHYLKLWHGSMTHNVDQIFLFQFWFKIMDKNQNAAWPQKIEFFIWCHIFGQILNSA